MADKSKFHSELINAGANSSFDFPAVPEGKRILIIKFGALDRALDNLGKGSFFVLQWGSAGNFAELAAISVVGNTIELPVSYQITGDGTKFLRVKSYNDSATNKQIIWWLKAKELDNGEY